MMDECVESIENPQELLTLDANGGYSETDMDLSDH